MVEILLRMKIEVGITTASVSFQRARGYDQKDAIPSTRACPVGCYVIDLAQPQKRLIKALLEPHTPQDEAFVREEVARFQRNERRGKSASKEDYRFYDITAWSLPLAFGLEAFWTDDAAAVPTSPVNEQTIQRIKTGSV